MAPRLRDTFQQLSGLLSVVEPVEEAYDVEWHGPYFIPRPRTWWSSHFLLYGGRVYGAISANGSAKRVSWDVRSGEYEFDHDTHGGHECVHPEKLWGQAAPQLARKIRSALRNPAAYNRRVARQLPLGARSGKILRRLTWPLGARAPLLPAMARRAEAAFARGAESRPLARLSRAGFLETVALALDAVYPELGGMSAEEKYRRKADGRHGGLLDLPADDPVAFQNWHASRQWTGCHPWEIVFAHPHGVLLQPVPALEGGWRLHLWVAALGLYLAAVRMAIALAEAGAPLEFENREAVLAALGGADRLGIGPWFDHLSVEELLRIRPKSVTRVIWDRLPEIRPITEEQRARVLHVLRVGSPAV